MCCGNFNAIYKHQALSVRSYCTCLSSGHALAAACCTKLFYVAMCSMVFGPNDSPIAGKEGSQLTGSKIGERLNAEAETSVSLRVLPVDGGGESFEVQARGELQLGLLIGEAKHLS